MGTSIPTEEQDVRKLELIRKNNLLSTLNTMTRKAAPSKRVTVGMNVDITERS